MGIFMGELLVYQRVTPKLVAVFHVPLKSYPYPKYGRNMFSLDKAFLYDLNALIAGKWEGIVCFGGGGW